MKKSTIYYMAQLAVVHFDDLTDAEKVEAIGVLVDDQRLAEHCEKQEAQNEGV